MKLEFLQWWFEILTLVRDNWTRIWYYIIREGTLHSQILFIPSQPSSNIAWNFVNCLILSMGLTDLKQQWKIFGCGSNIGNNDLWMYDAVLGNKIIDPYFIDGYLNGNSYANFLEHIFNPLLGDLFLITRWTMWYQMIA